MSRPSDRSHEHRLGMLRQEIAIANQVVASQKAVFEVLEGFEMIQGLQAPRRSTRAFRGGSGRVDHVVVPAARAGRRIRFERLDDEGSVDDRAAAISSDYATRISSGVTRSSRAPRSSYNPPPYRPSSPVPPPYSRRDIDVIPLSRIQTSSGSFSIGGDMDFKVRATDRGGYRDLLLHDCLSHLERRQQELRQFTGRAYWLQKEVR